MKTELQELFQLAAKFFLKIYKQEGGAQSTLAKELGITQSYLSSVTNGSRTASLDLYSQIADKLYGPLDKFLTVGRRIKEGREPLEQEEKPPEDSVEHLIARLTHYVVDHQRIEKELSQLKQFYETIVENQQTGILVMDSSNTVVYANKRMASLTDIPAKDIVGTTPNTAEENIPGLDTGSFKEKYNEAFETLEPVSYRNIRTKMPNGDILFISGSFFTKVNNGNFDGMICTIYDTTVSHILRNLLIQTLNYSADGIAVMQQTYPGELPNVYYLNKQFRKIFGLGRTDPSQHPFAKILENIEKKMSNAKSWRNFIKQSIGSNRTDARFVMKLKNGKSIEWKCNPLLDEEKVHWGRIVTVKQIEKKPGRKKSQSL